MPSTSSRSADVGWCECRGPVSVATDRRDDSMGIATWLCGDGTASGTQLRMPLVLLTQVFCGAGDGGCVGRSIDERSPATTSATTDDGEWTLVATPSETYTPVSSQHPLRLLGTVTRMREDGACIVSCGGGFVARIAAFGGDVGETVCLNVMASDRRETGGKRAALSSVECPPPSDLSGGGLRRSSRARTLQQSCTTRC
jgi:hypothetical protein